MKNIPARSWLQMPLSTGKKEIEKSMKKKFKSLFEKGDIQGLYNLFGKACVDRILKAFDTGGFGTWAPSSSPSPLVDTGAAKNAVSYEVKGAK